MTEDLAKRLSVLGVLAEPARRDLYLYVAAQPEPVGRDQVAAATGLPRHAVKFHLDRLVAQGLLEVEFRRLSARRGPGAGRPAKLYRRAARVFSVSLPERRYELAARILADAADEMGGPALAAAGRAAAATGRTVGAEARAAQAANPDVAVSIVDTLTSFGYEPRITCGQVVLVNCPFHALAADHTDLVCGMNLEFIRAMTQAVGPADVGVQLNPAPGRCCVTLDLPQGGIA